MTVVCTLEVRQLPPAAERPSLAGHCSILYRVTR